ncbi:MAG: helix-turn-helix domain-containing protein [Flavobacteriales bacterium]|nr:helix-turn-helix domain-containing protein [Flavobacteriales bacterium]
MSTKPNYTKIYKDLLSAKNEDTSIIKGKITTSLEVIKISDTVNQSGDEQMQKENYKLRAYDKDSVKEILEYQKEHNYTDSYISRKYGISRTTIKKWKDHYDDDSSNFFENNN